MFQFPGLALNPSVFRVQYLLVISVSPKTDPRTGLKPVLGITEIEGGFPHSEIRGSKLIRSSPRLIAAYHVLHRLCMPRHPPIALTTLNRSHCQCPSLCVYPELSRFTLEVGQTKTWLPFTTRSFMMSLTRRSGPFQKDVTPSDIRAGS